MLGKKSVEKIKKKKPVYGPNDPNPYNAKAGAEVIKSHKKNYDRIMNEINGKMSEIEREQKRKKKKSEM